MNRSSNFVYNSAGYCRAPNEYKAYPIIEKYLTKHYGPFQRQVRFDTGCIIDFYRKMSDDKIILAEVKNWTLEIGDMEQLLKYYTHATELYIEKNFKLIALVGEVDQRRQEILERIGIEIILTKDVLRELAEDVT